MNRLNRFGLIVFGALIATGVHFFLAQRTDCEEATLVLPSERKSSREIRLVLGHFGTTDGSRTIGKWLSQEALAESLRAIGGNVIRLVDHETFADGVLSIEAEPRPQGASYRGKVQDSMGCVVFTFSGQVERRRRTLANENPDQKLAERVCASIARQLTTLYATEVRFSVQAPQGLNAEKAEIFVDDRRAPREGLCLLPGGHVVTASLVGCETIHHALVVDRTVPKIRVKLRFAAKAMTTGQKERIVEPPAESTQMGMSMPVPEPVRTKQITSRVESTPAPSSAARGSVQIRLSLKGMNDVNAVHLFETLLLSKTGGRVGLAHPGEKADRLISVDYVADARRCSTYVVNGGFGEKPMHFMEFSNKYAWRLCDRRGELDEERVLLSHWVKNPLVGDAVPSTDEVDWELLSDAFRQGSEWVAACLMRQVHVVVKAPPGLDPDKAKILIDGKPTDVDLEQDGLSMLVGTHVVTGELSGCSSVRKTIHLVRDEYPEETLPVKVTIVFKKLSD